MASIFALSDAYQSLSLHLNGDAVTPYTGTGTPWTSQATTPFRLSMNDGTGPDYTPQAPQPSPVLSGAALFRTGADLILEGFPPKQETMGVQIYGTSHDTAVAALQALRRILSVVAASSPVVLEVRPQGASNSVYFEVLSAVVQETPDFLNKEVDSSKIRAQITWTLNPLGGRGSGETLINAVSMGNTGTGSPDNLESLGTSGTGDMIYAGGPLNITSTPGTWSSSTTEHLFATVFSRDYLANSTSLTTSSTTGAVAINGVGFANTLDAFVVRRNLRGRILARITGTSTNLEIRARLGSYLGLNWHTGPWVRAPTASGGSALLLDLGRFDPGFIYRVSTSSGATRALYVSIDSRSTNGSSATGTMASMEALFYYTFGGVYVNSLTSGSVRVESYADVGSVVALPRPVSAHHVVSNNWAGAYPFRGRPPVYIAGAGLWVAMRDGSTWVSSTSATTTVTATHAPLFHTLRGNG